MQAEQQRQDAGMEQEEHRQEEMAHMQLVLKEGLWIGDVYAAQDEKSLKEAGITAVLSLIIPAMTNIPSSIKHLSITIEDSANTDILSHLDQCVDWIDSVLREEREENIQRQRDDSTSNSDKGVMEGEKQVDIDNTTEGTKPKILRKGGVLVHCQAGMSRSATIVAAYLMKVLGVGVDEALDMIRNVRPVIEPSQTFREQLEVYHYARCRVSRKDKETRRWYLERTAMEVMQEGEFDPEATEHMAKFPSTPTPSQPATPVGGMARRKIRCKMCRRQLATREHMMDHILDQTPMVPRSRTPSMSLTLPSPMTTMDGPPLESSRASSPSMNEGERKRRNSRLGSMSSMTSPSVSSPLGMSISTATMDEAFEEAVVEEPGQARSNSNPTGRKVLDAEALAASLPPQLAALRAGVPGRPGTPPTAASNAARRISQPNSSKTDASTPSTRNQAAKRLSMMALTPSMNGNSALSRLSMDESAIASDGEQTGFTSMQREPAILSHDSKCSGYFVEPLTWMEPFLENGNMAGKILCPNEKCKAKIGNYDWAGVQCGCKEWVVPGFCIARNKVDEVW
ncbi:hypothetical protein FFLO_04872 [Filobasidium floriforme]|uniref:protein-tyrosine-phosphatase n=1 Tax=Filobasidium floriforme TaxID=5210 RepID=A0A8K0NLZ5_9TREE|nr:uncharacterized protein HD553DRAFT_278455 [Filobasidium floriforme]KAG7530702.1 hypothetical protein FFLO_04872 [Filobasidium floriforme]KAH8077796.1 hypothetical protein HD553DRAFT_278455 [Filobasidium floriforme]